jgi:hypothetical protein
MQELEESDDDDAIESERSVLMMGVDEERRRRHVSVVCHTILVNTVLKLPLISDLSNNLIKLQVKCIIFCVIIVHVWFKFLFF